MRRRALLAAVGTGCVAVGGCLDDLSVASDPTATPASDTDIRISNHTDATERVTGTITRRSERFFEDTVTVDPQETRRLDPGPIPKGDGYELLVETDDGRRETFPFSIEDYDVQQGSDLVVSIGDERLRAVMEE